MKKILLSLLLIVFICNINDKPVNSQDFNFSEKDKAIAHYNIAVNFIKRGELQKAIDEFQTSLTFNPDNTKAYYNMGIAYFNLNKFDKALECYNKVILITPNDAITHYNIGVTYSSLNKMNEAEQSYLNAIKYKNDFIEAHANLAMIYQYQDKVDQLNEELNILKKLDPGIAKRIVDAQNKKY